MWDEIRNIMPTPEHPTLLYYGDLDGQGKKRLVEASFEEDQPVSQSWPQLQHQCDAITWHEIPHVQRVCRR